MATTSFSGSPTYPGSAEMTVDALLKRPQVILRSLTDLVNKRFIADKIFTRGSSDQVAGGLALYQRSESIFPDRDVEEVGVRAEFPMTGWSEQLMSAFVHKYGLEVPISFEARRRNQLDIVPRAQRKLANALVRFVDTLAMTLLSTDTDIQNYTSSSLGSWGTAGNAVKDIANMIKLISDQDEGYEADTLIVNPTQNLQLLLDSDLRGLLPRETPSSQIQTGRVAPLLGLDQILVSPRVPASTVYVMQAKVGGTIADEVPEASEGYSSFAPGDGFAPIYMKVRMKEDTDEWRVRVARFPAMWISEPKSIVKITDA
jgi:hypothetical protein